MMDHDVLQLCKQLISIPSITPADNNCQQLLIDRLLVLDFKITQLNSGPVANFWAQRGSQAPLLVFAGHTDVVPTGNLANWETEPFKATIKDGMLYGRGAADMKGSLAAMIIACEQFITANPNHTGSIGFLITSGEEGDDFLHGTPVVMDYLSNLQQKIDWCILGEPSSKHAVGDMIKVGRRGSLTCHVTIKGQQGHVAYPHLADNPIHRSAAAIDALSKYQWDNGNEIFPPTSLQFTNMQAGTGANNVIPGELHVKFNIRYCNQQTASSLQDTITAIFSEYQLTTNIEWQLNAEPFVTKHGELISAVIAAINLHTQLEPELSTTGGTSDGRFIVPYGVELVELGPSNATIHKVNECVSCNDLIKLSQIYQQILNNLLLDKS